MTYCPFLKMVLFLLDLEVLWLESVLGIVLSNGLGRGSGRRGTEEGGERGSCAEQEVLDSAVRPDPVLDLEGRDD
jgi:hypothetical protein